MRQKTRSVFRNIVLSDKNDRNRMSLHRIIYANLKHTYKHTMSKYVKDLVFQKPQARKANGPINKY